jgi:hypothetical protein
MENATYATDRHMGFVPFLLDMREPLRETTTCTSCAAGNLETKTAQRLVFSGLSLWISFEFGIGVMIFLSSSEGQLFSKDSLMFQINEVNENVVAR